MEQAVAGKIFNRETLGRRSAIPANTNVMGRENFPAVLVGDHQRQTAIGKFVDRIVHPFPFPGGRANRREIVLVNLVGDQTRLRFFGATLDFVCRTGLPASCAFVRHFPGPGVKSKNAADVKTTPSGSSFSLDLGNRTLQY
jgi:hypothetical protein